MNEPENDEVVAGERIIIGSECGFIQCTLKNNGWLSISAETFGTQDLKCISLI